MYLLFVNRAILCSLLCFCIVIVYFVVLVEGVCVNFIYICRLIGHDRSRDMWVETMNMIVYAIYFIIASFWARGYINTGSIGIHKTVRICACAVKSG